MRIAVVHNRVAPDALPDEADVLCQADEVSETLRRLDTSRSACPAV